MPAYASPKSIASAHTLTSISGSKLGSQPSSDLATNLSNTANDERATDDHHIVIIGAGMAGSRLAIKLATAFQLSKTSDRLKATPTITLISKEKEVGYNRIMLSPVLAGETDFADTYLYDQSEYEQLDISVMAGVSVDSIDSANQNVVLDDGQTLAYDKLVLATGSTAKVIPFPNHKAKGVHVFRDVADVLTLSDYAKQGKTGLVIGGGVLGLEAACALSSQGAKMTVIHADSYVLNRQLDLPAALMLQEELTKRGVGLEVSAMTTTIEINEAGEVAGLSLKDGRTLPADFIVMAVGIAPHIELAKKSGITVNRAIVVDEYMRTSCDHIFAIGECVEINEELFGMVSSVNQHVDSLISVFTHLRDEQKWQPFATVPLSLKLKISGIAVFSAGQIEFDEAEAADVEKIVYRQLASEHYQCLYVKENRLIGAVLYGETSDGNFYSQLINEKTDISAFRDDLIYGAAYCECEADSIINPVVNVDIMNDAATSTKLDDADDKETAQNDADSADMVQGETA